MVTHASTYQLLRKLGLLNESTTDISRDDQLQLLRTNLRKHIKEAFGKIDIRNCPEQFRKWL